MRTKLWALGVRSDATPSPFAARQPLSMMVSSDCLALCTHGLSNWKIMSSKKLDWSPGRAGPHGKDVGALGQADKRHRQLCSSVHAPAR